MLVINHEEISEEVFKRLIEETVIEVTEENLKISYCLLQAGFEPGTFQQKSEVILNHKLATSIILF